MGLRLSIWLVASLCRCRRRRNSRRRAAGQNEPRYCLDSDGRYYKQQQQQHLYPLLLKPDRSAASVQPAAHQGVTASAARARGYTAALPAPPPPPPSFLLGANQYAAYTPVDAAGSVLGAAHPTSGLASTTSGRRISADLRGAGDATSSCAAAAAGRRPRPPPVEHIYESPKFARRDDREADSCDDDVSYADTGSAGYTGSGLTGRQMVLGGTSSAVVTTIQ